MHPQFLKFLSALEWKVINKKKELHFLTQTLFLIFIHLFVNNFPYLWVFFIIWFDLPFSMLRSSLIINKKRTFKVQEWSLNWWQVFSLEFRRFSQNAFSYRTSLDGYFWRPLMKFKVVKLPSIYIYIRLQLNFYRCPEFLPIFLDQFCEYFKKSLSTDV